MLALFQVTFFDQAGAVWEEVTEDQLGSPERLGWRRLVSNYCLFVEPGSWTSLPD